jgi:hypothetical protein
MTTTFLPQKTQKTAFWTKVEDGLPKDEEALYLVVLDGMIGFAWYRKDGDGNFVFNKEGVTHWAPTPPLPKD